MANNIKDVASILAENISNSGAGIFFLRLFSCFSGWMSRLRCCFLCRNRTIANSMMVPMTKNKDPDRYTPSAVNFVLEGLWVYLDNENDDIPNGIEDHIKDAGWTYSYFYLRYYLSRYWSLSGIGLLRGRVFRVLKMGEWWSWLAKCIQSQCWENNTLICMDTSFYPNSYEDKR